MKIYSHKRFLPVGARHVELLNPFWGLFDADTSAKSNLWMKDFLALGTFISLIDDIKEADIAILPGDWKQYQRRNQESLAHEFAEMVAGLGKRLLVVYHHDSAEKIPLKNAIILRTSMYRSTKRINEFVMPAWHTDYIREYTNGAVPPRSKESQPVVGFCGHAARYYSYAELWRDINTSLYRWTRGNPLFDHVTFRRKTLDYVKRSSGLKTNFIVRNHFMGGGKTEEMVNVRDWLPFQREFIENLFESDYILCVRGAGNFSFRFYETLCCGKVPVLVDTDCVLPYEDRIDWSKYIVRVDHSQVAHIGENILSFHNRLSPDDYLQLQQDCRDLWLGWLSPSGFFSNLWQVETERDYL